MSDDTTPPPDEPWPTEDQTEKSDHTGAATGDPDPAALRTGGPARPAGAGRRRRGVISGVAAAAVLLLLGGCLTAGLLVRSGLRWVDRAEDNEDKWDRLSQACLELETRLNRIVPPGAAGGAPSRRAVAIRDENAAIDPLLTELAAMNADTEHGWDRRRERWAGGWHQLIRARNAYADALRRQAVTGEPAFFVGPRDTDRGDVLVALERHGPGECTGPIHRLSAPDL